MLGYESPAEAIACITDTAHQLWMDAEERVRVNRQIEADRYIQNYECQFKRKDGSPVWVLLNCRCLRDGGGKVNLFEGSIQDISERKQAEDALKKTEANLSALIESTHDLIWAVDLEYRKVVFNRALKKNVEGSFGTRVEPGMRAEDDLPPERAMLWTPLYERALLEGPYRTEYPLIDGRTLELSFNPILVEGKATGVSVFGKDITERKRSEAQLRDSEAAYRITFDQKAMGIVHCSFDGVYLRCNARFAEIIGYAIEEVPGLTIPQLTFPEDCAQSTEVLRQLSESTTGTLTWEKRYKRRDGSVIWARMATSVQRDGAGTPLHQVSFVEDITQQKRAETQLRESRDFLVEAQRIGNLGCYVLDFVSGFWKSTPQLDEIFGIDPEYVRSVTGWAELIHPEDRAFMTNYFDLEVFGKGKDFDKEYRIVRASDGAERWVHGMGRLELDGSGRPTRMRGTIRDITEHKQSELAVAESEKLYRAITESSPLAYVILAGPEDRVEYVNPAFVELFGYTREEIPTAAEWWLLAYPEVEYQAWVKAEWQRKLPRTFASGSAMEPIETEIVCKNGSKKSVLWGFVRLGERNLAYGLDITERKQAERQLRESETRYRTVFQTSIDAISITRQEDGRIIDVNPEYLRLFGYGREQIIGLTTLELNIWTDCRDRLRMIEAMRREPVIREMEFLLQRKNGERFWGMISGARIDLEGVPCFLIVLRDISASKASAEALRESELRYRATFEQAPVGIVHAAIDGRYVRCNQRFAEIIGYPREEVCGLSYQNISLPKDLAEASQARERLLHEESATIRTEKQYIRKDGSLIWVRVSLTARRDCHGIVQYIIAVVEDIQARKDAEVRLAAAAEALRLSEERYRTAFQTSIDAMSISRLKDGQFIDVNQAFQRTFRCNREEVVGKTSNELKLWKSPSDRRRLVNTLRKHSVCHDLEFELNDRDGQSLSVLVSGALIELDGLLCFLLVIRDITETRASERRLAEAQSALRKSEERHRMAFQTSSNAVTIVRLRDGMLLDVNDAFLDTLGYEREEAMGRTTPELRIWADPGQMLEMIEALRREGVFRGDVQLRKKSGEIFWGRMSVSVFEHEGEACSLSVTQDISEAKAAEQRLAAATEALRKSEERYRTAFQTSIDAININRLSDGQYIDCNQAFVGILGYEREEVIGKTSMELNVWADPRDRQAMAEMVRQHGQCRDLEVQFKKKNGEIIWGEMSASEIEIDGTECVLSITRDISHMKTAENTIRNLAFYDSLTGLPNRRFLTEKLYQIQAAPRDGHSRALLFVELDHFKTLNETLGHLTGDLLLKEVAARISACVGSSDIVCRLGGDEFSVMLDELSESVEEAAAQAKDVGERIRTSIGLPCFLDGRECITTASIGSTVFGTEPPSIDELMQEADIALYQAKLAGRNTLRFFSPALQSAVNARATLEEDLRQAIKGEQFQLYYQPQVERGRLIGAEALIRWMHPKNGMVPPDAFIPLAEETGLILPVGDWVLEAACRQIAAWADRMETAHLAVAVNISALQFRQPGVC